MSQIFLSYSSSDIAWAQTLEDRLMTAGLEVFRDKSRLTAGKPYEEELFCALKCSSILLIVWSRRVRDMKGAWKEWIITERERFRAYHPDCPIIYIRLDNEEPQVDAHIHKLDMLRGVQGPGKVGDATWLQLTEEIKKISYSDEIRIICYILAATKEEFGRLNTDPNLQAVLQSLNLGFVQVADWYGVNRTDWKPGGGTSIKQIISDLAVSLNPVLKEIGAPERFRNCQITTEVVTTGLWAELDSEIPEEINRLARLDFCWIIIDPLSLYHDYVQKVARRIGPCADRNQCLNIFLIDPVGRILDRTNLRTKFQNDFSDIYKRLVKPQLLDNLSCLGGVDVWHADDFERTFRETIRLHRQAITNQNHEKSQKGALAHFGRK